MATVLLIDDNDHVRKSTTRLLTKLDLSVIGFCDGSLAREFMKGPEASTIRLIVCDVRMPVMDGIEFYQWIAENAPHLLNHFVFHSSSQDLLDDEESVKGVPRLDKPSDMKLFNETIKALYKTEKVECQAAAVPQM